MTTITTNPVVNPVGNPVGRGVGAPPAPAFAGANAGDHGALAAGRDPMADAAGQGVECAHCGLDVPRGLVEAGAAFQFCCEGCRAVHGIIHGGGLDRYYAMRRALERERAPAPATSAAETDTAAYDDPAVLARFTRVAADGTRDATLGIEGLHCAACVWLIERLPRVAPGVIEATVDLGRSSVRVRWDPAATGFAAVARGLTALGYRPSLPRGNSRDESRRREARGQLIRIGVAGALAGNVMLVTVALYAGMFEGIGAAEFTLFRWVSAGLGVLSLAWPGRVFFRGAVAALRARAPHLDLPIALALLVGGVWGLVNAARGVGEIYFDSLTALVFLLLVGRYLQSQRQRRTADALDLRLALVPTTVRLVDPADGTVAPRPIEAVSPGDEIEVLAGQTFPADGRITAGSTEADVSILTGESLPTPLGPGDTAWAGAVNLSGVVRLRVDAVGERSRAGRLAELVARAAATRAPIVHLADRIAGVFVVVVALLSTLTGIAWAFIDPGHAIDHATALLIVTCPCALGLATPLVLWSSIGRLARRGVLCKGGAPIESISRPGLALLDKTGTLTTGRLAVDHWTVDAQTAARVRALEATSTHPIARALAGSGPAWGGAVEMAEQRQGLGMSGRVGGVELVVGSEGSMAALGLGVPGPQREWAARVAGEGHTPVFIAEGGRVVGGVALSDTVRPDAAGLVGRLGRAGWTVGILSGDEPLAVAHVARAVGIDPGLAHGRVGPEAKLEAVRRAVAQWAGRGPVVMLGDGVNDAAALAAADVGIAAQDGSDASLDAADIAVQRGGLASVAMIIEEARGAIGRIRLCIAVSLVYNLVAAVLAVAGMIHPLLAAVLMPLSSLSVLSIASAPPRHRPMEPAPCR